MQYVYDFDIASMLFFGLTIFFYLYHKRLRNLQDTIFTVMLFASMTAVVFDFFAAYMEGYAMRYPVWLLYVVNALFLFGMQTCLPLFFLYAVAVSGKYHRLTRVRAFLCGIPYIVTISLLLLSFVSRIGIFYIDSTHIYRHGLTYYALYANMSFYVIVGVTVLLRNLKSIPRDKRNVILLFVLLLFTSVVLQIRLPNYLLTASATAMSLTSLFYVLQSPVDQVNPLTGAFSRMVLAPLLQDYAERGRVYTLVLASLRSFDELTRMHGSEAGSVLLTEYSAELIKTYRDDVVVFMDTSEFVIVCDGLLTAQQVEAMCSKAPTRMTVMGRTVRLDVRFGALPCAAGSDPSMDMATADFILRQLRTTEDDGVLFADEAYRKSCAAVMQMELDLERSFSAEDAELALEPIFDGRRMVLLEEARFLLPKQMRPYVTYAQFLQAVGRSGCAWEYYQALFEKLARACDVDQSGRRFCVTLLPAAFLLKDAPERMWALVTSAGFQPQQILFAVSEMELAVELAMLTNSIRDLSERGFSFMVDTFAEGYTDMSNLIALPLSYVRLHESLIENVETNVRAQALLKGLIGIFQDIGVVAVCPGIHSAQDAQAALEAGAPLLQGSYFHA